VPDQRRHRGAHPEDAALFAPDQHAALREAVADLAWLLSRGYADPSAQKVVGDRYHLTARQRTAVMRCACTDAARASRRAKEVAPDALNGRTLLLDGYNVLTTIEAALAGGVILAARDGCYRDVASVHGTYRKVEETVPALELAGEVMSTLGAARAVWYLDSPVSNSGRLMTVIDETAMFRGWDWQVRVVPNPDRDLSKPDAPGIVATADSVVLDACGAWLNLARLIVSRRVPEAWVDDLSDEARAAAAGEQP
jgi:hypothetical protein